MKLNCIGRIAYFSAYGRVGKDRLIASLKDQSSDRIIRFSLADNLKEMTHEHYGLGLLQADTFEAVKDQPHPAFATRARPQQTPREAYINYYLEVLRPRLGVNALVTLGAQQIQNLATDPSDIIAITGPGKQSEFDCLENMFGADDMDRRVLIRPYAPGKNGIDYREVLVSDKLRTFDVNITNLELATDLCSEFLDLTPKAAPALVGPGRRYA